MQQFNNGYSLKLTNGKEAVVTRFLGEGAQGAVFEVTVDGAPKALKVFRSEPSKQFLQNLKKNIEDGTTSPMFLWPEGMTHRLVGIHAYLMPLRPDGFHEFSKFRLAKVRFASFKAIIHAAIDLCDAFRLLHARGLSYQDLNDGGFFINPDTGEVRICDCDNVYPNGENSGILGKARYMAPEVVMGKTLPNSYSDRFSLSVILFMLFCIDHPFEGLNVVRRPCLTEEIERRLFGQDIVFVYDPNNACNRPVHGVHRNLLTMWPLLPDKLRDTFIEQFSQQVIHTPSGRKTEMQWLDIFVAIRDTLVRCPHCGDETFYSPGKACMNFRCGKPLNATFNLAGGGRRIPLLPANGLRLLKQGKAVGAIVANPKSSGDLLIKNLSQVNWIIVTSSGKSISIAPGGFMPVKEGLTISLTTNNQSFKLTIKK